MAHEPSSPALAWLAASHEGYCGVTTTDSGCGAGSNKGSWTLQAPTWAAATAECLQRCASCQRCSYLSLSLDQRDCSWFYRAPPRHHRTLRARH